MKCLNDKCWKEAIEKVEYCVECSQKLNKSRWSVEKMQAYIKAVMMPRQHEREMNDPHVKAVAQALL